MEQFLCTYSPPRPTFAEDATPDEQLAVAEHFAYLSAALDAGRLLLAGRTLDRPPMGLAILGAESLAAARSFFDADPAVVRGVFRAEVRPYRVALLRALEPGRSGPGTSGAS